MSVAEGAERDWCIGCAQNCKANAMGVYVGRKGTRFRRSEPLKGVREVSDLGSGMRDGCGDGILGRSCIVKMKILCAPP